MTMDNGMAGIIGGYGVRNSYHQGKSVSDSGDTGFLDAVSAKVAEKVTEQANAAEISFKDMLKSRYPGAYYNVMDTSRIDGSLWGRNDYPWDAYFSEPADESVLDWTPSGAEPPMQDSKVQNKINSMAGKMSIVIPPELEEKMKNDPELAGQIMDKVDGFITKYYRPEANQGFLITFDENGEINHACIACEGRITVSSSEFVEARKAREAKHDEYERLAEKIALKRKLMEQEAAEKSSIAEEIASIATYDKNIMEAAGILSKGEDLL